MASLKWTQPEVLGRSSGCRAILAAVNQPAVSQAQGFGGKEGKYLGEMLGHKKNV